jgi:hypothetical protein
MSNYNFQSNRKNASSIGESKLAQSHPLTSFYISHPTHRDSTFRDKINGSHVTTDTSQQYQRLMENDGFICPSQDRSVSGDVAITYIVPGINMRNEYSYQDGSGTGSTITGFIDDTWTNQCSRPNTDYTTWIIDNQTANTKITHATSSAMYSPNDANTNTEPSVFLNAPSSRNVCISQLID